MTRLEVVSVAKKLAIKGMATLQKVTCNNDAVFVGSFEADESTFKHISLTTQKAVIKNSKVGSLQICLNSSDDRQNVTVLELDNTIIEGDVTIDEKQHLELVLKGKSEFRGQIIGSHTLKK